MNGTVSWTIRQVGVFHRFEPSGKGNLWILLHASPQTKLQQHLEQTLSTRPEDVLQLWSSLHLMILFTYLGNWRWYIRHLGDGVENSVSCVDSSTFDRPLADIRSGRPRIHFRPLKVDQRQPYPVAYTGPSTAISGRQARATAFEYRGCSHHAAASRQHQLNIPLQEIYKRQGVPDGRRPVGIPYKCS